MPNLRRRKRKTLSFSTYYVRLLFDQNLSPRLKDRLADLYPESLHLRDVGLESADDIVVWEYAKQNRFLIVSKDSDFRQLNFTLGNPPKIVWIRSGNCSTLKIEYILRNHYKDILKFYNDEKSTFLTLI